MTCEAKKSTSKVEIVEVDFKPHPNADTLSVAMIHGGYSYCGKSSEWEGVKRAAYIPPDNIVDATRPEFSFLQSKPIFDSQGNFLGTTVDESITKVRVKAKKLRGVVSFGLMIPVPDDTPLGEDWADRLGVEHFDPEAAAERGGGLNIGETEPEPENVLTGPGKYDVDAGKRYAREAFVDGESVVVLEKADGGNQRVLWANDRLWVKSRNQWKRRTPDLSKLTVESLMEKGCDESKANEIVSKNAGREHQVSTFWKVAEEAVGVIDFCKANPGVVLFGECVGNTATLKYGLPQGNVFLVFDVFKDGRFLDYDEAKSLTEPFGIEWVPEIYRGPYSFDKMCELAEGKTQITGAKKTVLKEGVVARPVKERWHKSCGRVILKFVSSEYLLKK